MKPSPLEAFSAAFARVPRRRRPLIALLIDMLAENSHGEPRPNEHPKMREREREREYKNRSTRKRVRR